MIALTPAAIVRIDHDVAAALRRYNVAGTTIAIVDGNRVVFTHSYGLRDLRNGTPTTADTHYEIGSITKQITAALIVKLSEAGKIDLDAKVAAYVPTAPHANEVTLRQLLTMTSGLPDYIGDDSDTTLKKSATFDQLMARIAGKPLDFPPGSSEEYSNTNYAILGKVIEVVTGERYADYVERQILDPLGMSTTFTIADEARVPDMAVGYARVEGRMEPVSAWISQSYAYAAGDLVSTVGDLEKWDAALRAGRVVPPAGYALMTTPQKTTKGENAGYGFGLFIDSVDGEPRIGHTGGDYGFTSADEFFPKQDVRIIALTNDGDSNGHTEAGEMLTDIVFEDLYPEIARAELQPSPGEDTQLTARVRTFFEQMQSGHEDYGTMAPSLAAKFKTRYSSLFAGEFGPYGPITAVVYRGEHVQGGQQFHDYVLHFGPGVSLKVHVAFNDANQISALGFN